MNSRVSRIAQTLFFLGLITIWVGPLTAQIIQGTLTGNVSDSSGAAIPGVNITVTNEQTGTASRTVTTGAGVYSVPALPAGTYTVTAEKSGFQRMAIQGLQLGSAQTLRQDLTMKVGTLTEQVEVHAEAALISTDSQSVQTNFNTKQITELPQATQDIDGFLIMAAGVGRASFNSAPQIAGSTHWGADNFTLNGVSVNDPGNGGGSYSFGLGGVNLPALGSLQEVQIGGINMDARYSRIVNISMVTKSGTNQFHGDVYDYLQNNVLNATPFLLNAAGQKAPLLQRNQFGIDIGGPVIRNRTFFFFDYSGLRQRIPKTSLLNLPTLAERQGDFSALCKGFDAAGICTSGTQLYNPFTGDPFANNRIPSSMITSQAQAILKFVPAPTDLTALGLPSAAPNYTASVNQIFHVNKWDTRIDHTISAKDSIFGVFSWSVGDPWFNPLGTPPTYGNGGNYGYKTFTLSVNETHTFTPHTLNSFKAAWFDHAGIRSGQNGDFNPYTLFPQMTPSSNGGVPDITMTGYGAIGDVGLGLYFPEYDIEFSDDFTYTTGAHTIMAGFDETGFKAYSRGGAYTPLPTWGFDGSWTGNQGWPSLPHSNGNAFADFLLGTAVSAATGAPVTDKVNYSRDSEFYIQDSWKVNRRLTLNYGLRYVYQTPWSTRGNIVSYFDPKTGKIAIPENSSTVTAPPGTNAALLSIYPVETTQAAGLPLDYFKSDKNNIAPRVGVAWRPFDDHTVIRAGYGIFYNYNAAYVGPTQNANNIPWSSTFTYSSLRPKTPTTAYLPDLSFNAPLPGGSQTAPAANPTAFYMDPNDVNPRIQQWNVTIEHQFGDAWSARATYVGNHTDHLTFYTFNINIPSTQQLGVPLQKQRPYQPWGAINSVIPANLSNTNQLQLELTHRFSNGLQFQTEYSFTRCLDEGPPTGGPQNPSDLAADYGNCSFLVRHTFVTNYLYDLPFGRGKRWLKSGVLSQVAGGWSVSGITSYLSGQPFSVAFQVPSSQVGWWGGRADVLPGADPYTGDHSHNLGTLWFNPAAFAPPAPGTWGNSPRNGYFGPGMYNWDISLMKNIYTVGDRQRLQIRGDFFDAFNHFNPDAGLQTTIADTRDGGAAIPAAGRITSGESSRVIQVSLRYFF
ncbi:MAG TPA: TonB-dependent receptor [Bryobacteraceae bacterium]|nr:TonB-dependent receptor [Bryobacteraceae bacterium]